MQGLRDGTGMEHLIEIHKINFIKFKKKGLRLVQLLETQLFVINISALWKNRIILRILSANTFYIIIIKVEASDP